MELRSELEAAPVTELAADASRLLEALPGAAGGVELSVLVVGDARIRELNLAWRGIDRATDVLSFPQDDPLLLGDVVLSLETAARQAAERGCSLRDELRVLLLHGLLHLLGHDHEDPRERAEMAAREAALLGRLGWRGGGLVAGGGGRD